MSGADLRNLQGALHRRDRTAATRAASHAEEAICEFRIQTFGSGTSQPVRCDFIYAFEQEPSIRTGHSIVDGDAVLGYRPSATTTVTRWHQVNGIYVAADIVLETTGHPRQRLNVRIEFAGTALMIPLASMLSAQSNTTNTEV